MIGPLTSWIVAAESGAYDSPLNPWQKCARCGHKVDLPDDVLKAADRAYCSEECLPSPRGWGEVDVSRLDKRRRMAT